MMTSVSNADFSALSLLAIVADKVYDEEHNLKPLINIPISENKPLPFNLNLKPRTYGRPRSSPIDVHALFPCLHRKRKLEEINENIEGKIGNSKKLRLIVRLQQPELPLEYKQKISELGGSDMKLMIEKRLHKSDVKKKKGRLTMPYRKCLFDFDAIGEMQVKVVQPANNLSEMIVTFARWYTESSYVFTGSWNDIVEANDLKKNDVVQVGCPKYPEGSVYHDKGRIPIC